jgi:hypothetical protein
LYHFPHSNHRLQSTPQKIQSVELIATMIALWKPIVSILLLSATTVLAADQEFILEEDGIVQIICSEGNPIGVCKFNGEVANSFSSQGVMTTSYGNGVCQACPTNQPADTVTCEEAAVCTCIKCDDIDCKNPQGDCDIVGAEDSGATVSASTLAAGLLTAAGALML